LKTEEETAGVFGTYLAVVMGRLTVLLEQQWPNFYLKDWFHWPIFQFV